MIRYSKQSLGKARCLRRLEFLALAGFGAALLASAAHAQNLPDGPGKDSVIKSCSTCHEVARVMTLHQSRDDWQATLLKMKSLGAVVSDDDFNKILDYLSTNFPPAAASLVNVNNASATELEIALGITHKESISVVQYRDQNGKFKSIADLEKVPGLDPKKIEANKGSITF